MKLGTMHYWVWRMVCVVIILGTFSIKGLNAEDMVDSSHEIPAVILDALQNEVKPPLIELLSKSEFNTLGELKESLIKTNNVLETFSKKFAHDLGFDVQASSATSSSVTSAAPVIIGTSPVAGVMQEETASDQEIKPEPPAAAVNIPTTAIMPSDVPEAIQPPALLAAPAPVIPMGLPTAGEIGIPNPGIVPGAPVQAPLQPESEEVVEETPVTGPVISIPAISNVVPSPFIPPVQSVPVTPPQMIAPVAPTVVPMGLPPLALAPVFSQDLESLDMNIEEVIAMNAASLTLPQDVVTLPAQPLDIVPADQESILNNEHPAYDDNSNPYATIGRLVEAYS